METTIFFKVKNYGPLGIGTSELNDGYLSVPKYTFFIGDQGTGKSTVAKLISTFSWIEKALVRKTIEASSITLDALLTMLSNQNLPKEYLTSATEIEYRGNAYVLSVANKKILIKGSSSFDDFLCPQIMYYPSERNILSAIDNPWEIKGLPEMVVTLATEYLEAQKNNNDVKPLFNDYKIDFDPVTKQSFVQDPQKQTRIPITSASSGLQSVAPLIVVSDHLTNKVHKDLFERMKKESVRTRSLILESIKDEELKEKLKSFFSSSIKDSFSEQEINKLESVSCKYVNSTLLQIVEEPEQNLYPTSQVIIAEKLIENTNNIGKLMITTHSPYILSAVNNYIFANDLKDKINKEITGLSTKCFIEFEDVAAFKLDNGKIISILDEEARMIDATEIDECSYHINQLFDTLIDIKERADEH